MRVNCNALKETETALKSSALLVATGIALSFLGCIAIIVYLAVEGIVTRQMATLLGIALLGFYIGFGILIGVYRLINKLD